jgi:hypothetical protein
MKFSFMQFSPALRNLLIVPNVVPFFPVAPALEHRASVKRFVSFQFLIPKPVSRTSWTGDQPIARPLTECS